MTPEQIQWLTWGAIQHRPSGAPKWDEPGTHKAITDHCGSWGLSIATEHVLAHARDPKAKTPFVIKGPMPHTEPVKAVRQPAKAGVNECRLHRGEYANACRACAVEQYTHPADPAIDDDLSAGRQLLTEIRARRGPEPSPAPDAATSESAVDDAASSPGREPQDVQQRAGEPDRPETACAADGCYRPTRDGICDRCRAKAAAEAVDAANAELIDRLHANERERARTRPAPDPTATPRLFTSADYDPQRVHAAQALAAAERSTA